MHWGPTGRIVALAACLLAVGCSRGGSDPSPPPRPWVTLAPTTTVDRVPNLTADPIAGVSTQAIHAELAALGFTTAEPTTAPGFVTTTSRRADATVSTYGTGAADVVQVVAEASTQAAPTVLPAVVVAVVKGADAKKAGAWVSAELKKGPSPAAPRSSSATYGKLPHDLIITTKTATLSIGRLSR
jgi:hypothetical protein